MISKYTYLLLFALVGLAAVLTSARSVQEPKSPLKRVAKQFQQPTVPQGYVSNSSRTMGGRFRVQLDHFNPQNRDSFEFNYYSNDAHYRPGGPIFLVVGGSWPVSTYYIEHGLFFDLAVEEGAWLFTNEHRYYGTSIPVNTYSTENLQFLKTEQALLDLVNWIEYLRHDVVQDPNAKVILLGTGYAGALATWARQRFPRMVDGAWATGATVLASFDFQEYAVDVGEIIRQFGGDHCHNVLWQAFRTAQNLILVDHTDTLTDLLNTCEPMSPDSLLDVETFFFHLKLAVQDAVFEYYDIDDIQRMCTVLTDDSFPTSLHALANWVLEHYYYLSCNPFDFDVNVEAGLWENPGYPENSIFGIRQTHYQLCTEFGWFLTTDADDQPFGDRVTMHYFLETCRAMFGEWITDAVVYDGVRLTNLHYGGQDPQSTHVLFTNSALDPYRLLSVTSYVNAQSYAFTIQGEFINSDLTSISDSDSPDLLEVKHQIGNYIRLWLGTTLIPG